MRDLSPWPELVAPAAGPRPAPRGLRSAALCYATLGLFAACGEQPPSDFGTRPTFNGALIVGGQGARRGADGTWARACDGPHDGLTTNLVLIGTGRGDGDQDLALRPGDEVDGRVIAGGGADDIVLAPPHVALASVCLSAVPEGDGLAGPCDVALGAPALAAMSYVAHVPRREVRHDVVVLIDQSGSIHGHVDAETLAEGEPASVPGRDDLASDRLDLRLVAVRTFVESLNAADRVALLEFGEGLPGGLRVPCAAAAGRAVDDGLAACAGTDRDVWLGPTGLGAQAPAPGGRANLWQAVAAAHRFLVATGGDPKRSRHVVVVTDGADTSRGEVDVDDVLAALHADGAPDVQVHFVRFESVGAPGRDADQVDVACTSGGTYQHIDTSRFRRDALAALASAFDTALLGVRGSLAGHWELTFEVDAPASEALSRLPDSDLVVYQGLLSIRATSSMTAGDRAFPFGPGQGLAAEDVADCRRVHLC